MLVKKRGGGNGSLRYNQPYGTIQGDYAIIVEATTKHNFGTPGEVEGQNSGGVHMVRSHTSGCSTWYRLFLLLTATEDISLHKQICTILIYVVGYCVE